MPKYSMSYAYDVPSYADFTIEAESATAALKKAKHLLKEGCFDLVTADPNPEFAGDYRVFLHDDKPTEDDGLPPVEELKGFAPIDTQTKG